MQDLKARRYYLKHREEIIRRAIEWQKTHPERTKEIKRKYSRNYNKELYQSEPEEVKEANKRWRQKNLKRVRETQRLWRQANPDKAKKTYLKHQSNRRELGFIPLNTWFEGSNAHHINKYYIIYIPIDVHKAYPHNHKKPETMKIINKVAIEMCLLGVRQDPAGELRAAGSNSVP